MSKLRETVIAAARVLLPGGWLEPGAVLVRSGVVAAVGAPAELLARAPGAERVELAGSALLPGLVNAHAHLELTGFVGRTPRGATFGAWVREVVRLRASAAASELGAAAVRGAELCLASGATTVGDFDGSGAAERAFAGRERASGPRIVLFRELLDARDGARTASELARLAAPRAESELCLPGLAPHAPHTVSAALLAGAARAAREQRIPAATHWAETAEEGLWLEQGGGPFAALLGEPPRRPGLDLLAEAGLLGPGLALVHGNCASADERARVASSGATLVHCPGTHAFFARAPFDARPWRGAGVAVALGTDSLASNGSLDLRLEQGRFAASNPWLSPRELWDAATVHGARALGLAGRAGEISAGAFADLLAVPAPEPRAEQVLARIARGEFELTALWVAGRLLARPVPSPGCAPAGSNPG